MSGSDIERLSVDDDMMTSRITVSGKNLVKYGAPSHKAGNWFLPKIYKTKASFYSFIENNGRDR